ncbi:hypothetical protein CF319_g8905 [Tilletia indica]|nr:hypothetical protein CF319_g8905 [Tilletia indica]
MSSTTQFLTFTPSERLASRSIAFHTSDHLEISLGGTCLHRNPHSRFSVQESPFFLDEHTVEPDHATILCSNGRILLTHQDRDGTTRINGQPLNRDQRHLLRHGDQIELGYYEPMDDEYSFTLLLRVEVSSSPPPLSSTRARFPSPDQFLPTTRSVLYAFDELHRSTQRLSAELASTQARLQDALDAASAHICVTPPSPRSYGTLLADLRVRPEATDFSSSYRPSRTLASASDCPSRSCSSPSLIDSQPSSARSSASASPCATATSACTRSPISRPQGELQHRSSPASHSPSSTQSSVSTSAGQTSPSSSSAPTSLPSSITSVLTSVLPPESSSTTPSPSIPIPSSTSVLTSVLESAPPSASLPTLGSSTIFSALPTSSAQASAQSNNSLLPSSAVLSSTPATSSPSSSFDTDDARLDVLETTVTGVTSSADIALMRIRSAWSRARAAVLDGSRGVQHAQLALTRVLDAWRTERAAVTASPGTPASSARLSLPRPKSDDSPLHSYGSTTSPLVCTPLSFQSLPAACSMISPFHGWPGTFLSPVAMLFPSWHRPVPPSSAPRPRTARPLQPHCRR